MTVLTVNNDQDIAVVGSEWMRLQYSDNGVSWHTIEGVTDYAISNAATPTREIIPTAGHIKTRNSRVRPATVTFQSYFIPNDLHWRRLQDACTNGDVLEFRIQTDGEQVFLADATNGATFYVSAAGVVTFKPGTAQGVPTVSNCSFGVGSVINTVAKDYVVTSIGSGADDNGVPTVVDMEDYEPPEAIAESSAVRFSIYSPAPQQYAFTAYVTNIFEASLNAESELMTPLTLTLRAPFPKPTVLDGLFELQPSP